MSTVCRCGKPLHPRAKPCRHGVRRWAGYVSVVVAACGAWTVKTGLVLGLGAVVAFT